MRDEESLSAAARERFSDMDTDTLNGLWANEGRTEWAERALRFELLKRGISEHELDAIARQRADIAAKAPPSARDTIWNYGVVGRVVAVAAVLTWALVTRALGGAGLVVEVGCCAILGLYVYVLTKRVSAQKKHPTTASARFAMNWQLGEAWVLLIGAVFVSVFASLG